MAINFTSTFKFIPEFGGERKKAKEDPSYKPVTIVLKAMTTEEYRHYCRDYTDSLEEGKTTQATLDILKDVVSKGVASVENLSFNGKVVKEGEEILAFPMGHKLVNEIEEALTSNAHMDEEQEKNSDAS